jgi:hypothetical protein
MFVPRTAGTVLTASDTEAMSGGGARVTNINNYRFAAPTDPRTQQQLSQRVGYETDRALRRNR